VLTREWFKSTPTNDSYDAMFVAVTATLGLMQAYSGLLESKFNSSYAWYNALDVFEILLSLLTFVLSFSAGIVGAGITYLLYFLFVLTTTIILRKVQTNNLQESSLQLKIKPKRSTFYFLAAFYSLFAIGFIVFPVSQPWDTVALFVRWHQYTVNGELVWRGVFFSYAFCFLYCLLDPFAIHRKFVQYVALSGFLHATVMLVLNLVAANSEDIETKTKNGNHEHLYGDIAGWYFISLVSALSLLINNLFEKDAQATSINP
jgi:hypothetical protein